MVYVMSDIHGNMERFDSILRQIDLQAEDKLYILGDVIDRFPDGIRILRRIMKMPNVQMLLGNHEYMMMNAFAPKETFIDAPWSDEPPRKAYQLWYRNGGKVTHDYLKRIRKTVRQEICDYIYSLPLNLEVEVNGTKYMLVHGGAEAVFEDWLLDWYPSKRAYAVWFRQRLWDPPVPDHVMIFGHTPTIEYAHEPLLSIWHNRDGDKIGIDCGGGYPPPDPDDRFGFYGRLACLRLDDMKEFYSDDGGFANAQRTEASED